MKKFLKPILSSILAGTMILSSMATVFAAGPYTAANSGTDVYFFEDFNDAAPNGTIIWNWHSAIGSNLLENLPFGKYLLHNNPNRSGSAALEGDVDFDEDGEFKNVVDTYASFAFDRAYNNSFFISGRKVPETRSETNKTSHDKSDVLKGFLPTWIDFSGWILVTADIKVPTSSGSDYTLKGYISHVVDENTCGDGVRVPKYVAATFPDIKVSADNKTVTAIGEGAPKDAMADMNKSMSDGNRNTENQVVLTGVKAGDWIQLQVVIQKNIYNETRKYQVWQFVNGQQVSAAYSNDFSGQFVNANGDNGFTEFVKDNVRTTGKNNKGLTVDFISSAQATTNTARYLGIDNVKFVAMGTNESFDVKPEKDKYEMSPDSGTGKVENAVIKFKNKNRNFVNADKSTVKTASGLEALEEGALQSGAAITVKKCDAKTGAEKSTYTTADIIDTDWGTRVKERTRKYGSDSGNEDIPLGFEDDLSKIIPNGTELHLKNLALAEDEKAVVTIAGKDLAGKNVNATVEIYNAARDGYVRDIEIQNNSGTTKIELLADPEFDTDIILAAYDADHRLLSVDLFNRENLTKGNSIIDPNSNWHTGGRGFTWDGTEQTTYVWAGLTSGVYAQNVAYHKVFVWDIAGGLRPILPFTKRDVVVNNPAN